MTENKEINDIKELYTSKKGNMKKTGKSPIFRKEINKFLNANRKIKDALDLFEISEEEYVKAIRSLEPQATTTNKIVIEVEA